MSSENIIILLIAILAAVGAFVDIEYVPLGLVLLGLVAGFMNPSTDMAAVSYTHLTLPTKA